MAPGAQRGRMGANGRVQVPADMRRELGLNDGDPLILRLVDGELHVRPARDALSRIQAKLQAYAADDTPSGDAPGAARHDEPADA